MPEDDLPDRLVLRPSRVKLFLILTTAVLFLIGTLRRIATYPGDLDAWLGLAFCAGVVALSIGMIRPGGSTLTLERDAFTVRHPGHRAVRTRWIETGPFIPWKGIGHVRALVRYDAPPRTGQLATLGNRFNGGEHGLPDTYGLGAHELAALLERWRRRARRDAGLPD